MMIKKCKLLAVSFLAVVIFGCDKKSNSEENLFSFDGSVLKEHYRNSDIVDLQIVNPEKKAIDSIIYYVNGTNVGSVKGAGKKTATLTDVKLGYQNLKALIYFEGEAAEVSERIEVVSSIEPKLLKYTLVNMFAHDPKSFTQGLEFYRDTLYESTGQHGTSFVKKYDYLTGKVYKQVNLDQQYFGEGITILNNNLYQLTYKSGVGFVYDVDTFERKKTFTYDKPVEGWGFTNDGKYLFQSDGTEKIWKVDPKTLKMIDYINVYSQSGKIKSVNELEYINGKFWGNIWQRDAVAVIDPATGAVEGILNLAGLREQVKNPEAEVLNGIAYNRKTKTIFVTGKNWDKMFEIKVSE